MGGLTHRPCVWYNVEYVRITANPSTSKGTTYPMINPLKLGAPAPRFVSNSKAKPFRHRSPQYQEREAKFCGVWEMLSFHHETRRASDNLTGTAPTAVYWLGPVYTPDDTLSPCVCLIYEDGYYLVYSYNDIRRIIREYRRNRSNLRLACGLVQAQEITDGSYSETGEWIDLVDADPTGV